MSSDGVTPTSEDSFVNNVIEKYVSRSAVGMEKYGTNLERTDLSEEDWLVHLQEELMDAILYIQAARDEIKDLANEKEE